MLVLATAASSTLYHTYTAGCLSLRESVPVSVKNVEGGERARLYWNLSRFNEVEENGPVTFVLTEVPLFTRPNIPDPILYYPYFLLKLLHTALPEQLVRRLGLHDPRIAKSVFLEKRVSSVPDADREAPPDQAP